MSDTKRAPEVMTGIGDVSTRSGRAAGTERRPSPYDVNPYAAPARRSGHGVVGCILTLLAMAALSLGMIYLMWRAGGK